MIFAAEMSLVICENEEKCKSLLTDTPACLKIMVHIKSISNATVELAKSKGITTLSFEYVENLGAQNKHKPTVVSANINQLPFQISRFNEIYFLLSPA
jgi:long-chain acyl-CoA synthetase